MYLLLLLKLSAAQKDKSDVQDENGLNLKFENIRQI